MKSISDNPTNGNEPKGLIETSKLKTFSKNNKIQILLTCK
jgi:hypothetical protein